MKLNLVLLTATLAIALLQQQAKANYVTYFIGNSLLRQSLPIFEFNQQLPEQIIVPLGICEAPCINNITITRPNLTHNEKGFLLTTQIDDTPATQFVDTVKYIATLDFFYNVSNNVTGYGNAVIASTSFNYTVIYQFLFGQPYLVVGIDINNTISDVTIEGQDPDTLAIVSGVLNGSVGNYISLYLASEYQNKADKLTEYLQTYYPVLTNYSFESHLWATFNTSLTFGGITDEGILINLDGEVIGYPGNNPFFPNFTAEEGSIQMAIHYNALHDFIFYSNKQGHFDAILDSSDFKIPNFSYTAGDFLQIIPDLSKKYHANTPIVLQLKTDKSCSRSPLIQLNSTSNTVNVNIYYYCLVNLDNGTTLAGILIQPEFVFEIGIEENGDVIVKVADVRLETQPVVENFELNEKEQEKLNNLVNKALVGLVNSVAPGSKLIKFSNVNPKVTIQPPVILLQDLIISEDPNKPIRVTW